MEGEQRGRFQLLLEFDVGLSGFQSSRSLSAPTYKVEQ